MTSRAGQRGERNRRERATREPVDSPIAPWLLELLVCPADHGALSVIESGLVCRVCGRRYPVVDGIPRLLLERGEEQAF
jgi:uncharacterized protein YbaR (Trm112 family)